MLPRTIRTAATDDRLSRTLKRKVKGNKDLAVSNLRNEKETRSEISRQRDPGRRVREKS